MQEQGCAFNEETEFLKPPRQLDGLTHFLSERFLSKRTYERMEEPDASDFDIFVSFKRLKLHNGVINWNPSDEEVPIKEKIEWLPRPQFPLPELKVMSDWIIIGPRLLTAENQSRFCDSEILHWLILSKNTLNNVEYERMANARDRANPYEMIKGAIFMNRSAMKVANIDCIYGFILTNPIDQMGKPIVSSSELLYFADLCAGPGGFSEYILWRKKWKAKGFGFTLKNSCDFRLDHFFYGHAETFELHYGEGGIEGNGNIYEKGNMVAFRNFVLDNTNHKGVHFTMADGAFSVNGKENEQELLHKQLYVCQLALGISITRLGGHFVCKLFDIFTDFSVGLIYLMNQAFHEVSIHKPLSSRSGNSERYLICKWKRGDSDDIEKYLFNLNDEITNFKGSDVDILECVPLSVIVEDNSFKNFITQSNNAIGGRQLFYLSKIKAFLDNTQLQEYKKQIRIKNECLQLWDIPRMERKRDESINPLQFILDRFSSDDAPKLKQRMKVLDRDILQRIKNPYDYHCTITGYTQSNCMFVLGAGRSRNYTLNGSYTKWLEMDLMFELPRRTLLYVEMVPEFEGDGSSQRKHNTLHVIDAIFLGDEDVRGLHYTTRLEKTRQLIEAVTKNSIPNYTKLRVKDIFKLSDVKQMFEKLELKNLRTISEKRLCCHIDDSRIYAGTGMFIFKTIKDPWTIAFSKQCRRFYYYNKITQESNFKCANGAISNFIECFESRIHWTWDLNFQLGEPKHPKSKCIDKHKFTNYITQITR